ncbi:V-set and transmembrane domain-containing protein 4 isoform X2 [Conger conger]|uniref:V-set and transmembrane domain-containing protein 4 isoform X2 n=1 Tax=Conger conger TaxID=82655 RepID=UPI002A5AF66A|nr:V-set and transmembrane domain-containing protein 4 isoform X2 [Conger conger]
MKISSAVIVLLTRAFLGELCQALNVTVSPGPVAMSLERENITLSCQVSQKRKANSLLVVRWLFSAGGGVEQLIVKLNMKRAKFYGNYTKHFGRPKLKLFEAKQGRTYNLLVLNISEEDRGLYICRVLEIRKSQNRWRAASNGTATTELRVHVLPDMKSKEGIWQLFSDVYLCAVLICSVGLLCMCMFTVVITCQYLHRKQRAKASYFLVKSPQSSSGETVTSVVSSSPVIPKKKKKYRRKTSQEHADTPPAIPAKAPIAERLRKPKLLKAQPRKVVLPKIAEESLMYAELELVKPLPETKAACTGTVYAQILFEEKQL